MLFEAVAKYYEKLEGTSSRLAMIDVLSEMLKEADKDEIKKLVYMTQGVLAPPFEGVQVGIAEKFAEHAISIATGYEQAQVLQSYKKLGDLGLTAGEFAGKTKLRGLRRTKFEVTYVFDTILKIANTSGSGSQDMKIKMLVELLGASSPLEARYIMRFALGELRLGAGDATILEALSKAYTGDREFKVKLEGAYNMCGDLGKVADVLVRKGKEGIENFKVSLFNPIRPALAERLPTAEEILEKMKGKCSVESKYDGLRAQVHISKAKGRVEIFSRNLERLTPMFPEIAKAALKEVNAREAIFEGEAIAYNDATKEFRPFQETIQRKRKHGIEELSEQMPLHLFAFDLMYLDGVDYTNLPYEKRRRKLESIVEGDGTIRFSDMIIATTAKEIDKYFEQMVGNGLEGIVAKDLNSPYVAGARKFSWIKLKRSYKGELSDTVDLVIVGYYVGRGVRAEFGFGGLLTATYNEKTDIFETITRIGTGFTEANMKMFKELLDHHKSKKKPARVNAVVEPDFWVDPEFVVEVRADEITRSPMHTCGRDGGEEGYALRFPRIVSDGVRGDKKPEDATTTKEIIEMFGMQKRIRVADS
ncbi:MAG: ATP-dependent DNA ligase [Candidatus Micrarchaeota archaeon]|nr:ATP-dependent DNA ligase [Candidatus Micrarchaeota archaeon]